MVVGKLHCAVEAFLEIRRRLRRGRILAVEYLSTDRLVTRGRRRLLHVDGELFFFRQRVEAPGAFELRVDQPLWYAVVLDVEEPDLPTSLVNVRWRFAPGKIDDRDALGDAGWRVGD